MSGFPNSPQLLKGGLVLLDAATGSVQRLIVLQYNPDSLTRTLQARSVGAESGDRSEALRLSGPPIETIKLEAEMDATDQLEFPEQNPLAPQYGIQPQLAALETVLYPTCRQLQANHALAQAGTLEIVPMEAPLVLFVWSQHRTVPVRITEFSVTEEAFDPALHPIRARVSLGLRVLSVDDVGFTHRAGSLYLAYQQQKETLAVLSQSGSLSTLGITRIA